MKITYDEMKQKFEDSKDIKHSWLKSFLPEDTGGERDIFFDLDRQLSGLIYDEEKIKNGDKYPLVFLMEMGEPVDGETSLNLTGYSAIKEHGGWVFEKNKIK